MAIQEQLGILEQGAKAWNTWRAQHLPTSIDLRGVDLRGVTLNEATLSEANLSRADLRGVDLRGVDLRGVTLNEATLSEANLSEANLSGANLSGANLSDVDLSKANLSGANLSGANVSDVDLRGANLRGANLRRVDLRGSIFNEDELSDVEPSRANLSDVDLSGVDLRGIDLRGVTLSGANLNEANLNEANLNEANLSDANLSGADLIEANLNEANLSGADLSDANLSGADLSDANLNRTNLNRANLSEATLGRTILSDIDLRTVKGLETIKHETYSAFATSTLARSQGDIPELFLRGVGVDDILIEHIRSLYAKAIDYYTCFISYSSKDELFARRLHNDLQQEGVRCWFAPEDLDIGDKIRHRIEESIRLYDKLLLILSEHSITSSWVEYEVERALNKEPQGVPNVLYPVRVDQAVMTCSKAWARDIKSTRHIGDFENWPDPPQYEKSFKRLLRALNAKKE